MFNLLKKIVIYLLIILGIMYAYHYMTGKSITTLPREIVNKMQEKGPHAIKSTNPRYYTDPEKNMPANNNQ